MYTFTFKLEPDFSILQLNWVATSINNESIIDRNELLKAIKTGSHGGRVL